MRPRYACSSVAARWPGLSSRIWPRSATHGTSRCASSRSTASFPTAGQGLDYAYGPVTPLDTAQLDTTHGSEFIDAAGQLETYRLVLDRMEHVALAPAASRDLIHSIAKST